MRLCCSRGALPDLGSAGLLQIIMVDPAHNAIRKDPRINWLCDSSMKHREMRGLTSAGKHSRGLRNKGVGSHKCRPSRRGTWKKNNSTVIRRYRPTKTN